MLKETGPLITPSTLQPAKMYVLRWGRVDNMACRSSLVTEAHSTLRKGQMGGGFMHTPQDELSTHVFCSSLERSTGYKCEREAPSSFLPCRSSGTQPVFSALPTYPWGLSSLARLPKEWGVPTAPVRSPSPTQVHRSFQLRSSLLQETDGSNKDNKQHFKGSGSLELRSQACS